jgi:hypothetical protein
MRINAAILWLALMPTALVANRSVDIQAAYSYARAVETFPDPLFVDEFAYLSSSAQQAKVQAAFHDFFPAYFQIAYQALSVAAQSESRSGKLYSMEGYTTSFLHAATAFDSGIFRWQFGFAALITFGNRNYYDANTGAVLNDTAVNTRLSQAYPSGGFTLFPKAPIRFSLQFLNGDADLVYGWLRIQIELEAGRHTIFPAFELLNHASFGRGLPNFSQPPGAFVLGYGIKFEEFRLFSRLGFVLNATQGFNNAHVTFADRLLFEFGIGYKFAL